MPDFAQLKVGQIKEAVLKKDPNFIDRDVVGKSAWVKTAQDMGLTADDIVVLSDTLIINTDNPVTEDGSPPWKEVFEEAELEEDTVEQKKSEEKSFEGDVPRYTEVGWHDYVMSRFHETELDRGYPKVEGMRRLAEELLGEILFSGAIDVKSSMPDEDHRSGRSVVNYEVQIAWKNGVEPFVFNDGSHTVFTTRAFRGLASCYPGNVKGNVFINFPESIAETRAEARALRKALGLKVVAAEEFGDVEQDSISSEKIQPQQIFVIEHKVKENSLNLVDILTGFGLDKLEDADRKTAADIIKRVNELIKIEPEEEKKK